MMAAHERHDSIEMNAMEHLKHDVAVHEERLRHADAIHASAVEDRKACNLQSDFDN